MAGDSTTSKRCDDVDVECSGGGAPAGADASKPAEIDPFADDEARFFDSRDYRCCCNIFHAKIGTFVFCTWIFHEIVLGTLYLVSHDGFKDNGTWRTWSAILLACRLIQIVSVALLYVGLWRYRPLLLAPFAVVQITIGYFADVCTLRLILDDIRASSYASLLFTDDIEWLNLCLPATIYAALLLALLWVLYKCYVFLRARSAHDAKRLKSRESESGGGGGLGGAASQGLRLLSPRRKPRRSAPPSALAAHPIHEQNETLM